MLRIHSEEAIKGEEILENKHIKSFFKFEMNFKTFKPLVSHKEMSVIVDAIYLKKSRLGK